MDENAIIQFQKQIIFLTMRRPLLNLLVRMLIKLLTFQWCKETGCLDIVYLKKNLAEGNALNTVLKLLKSFQKN